MPLRRPLFLAVLLCLAALVPAAAARADGEPNDALVQAEGPIHGGTNVAGTLGTPDDVDWYVFYVQGQQQLHLTHTSSSDDDLCGLVSLKDTDGADVPEDFTSPPGTNRYFAKVWNDSSYCASTSYTFKIDPAGAVVSGPPIQRAQGTGEPNETKDQPAGPLQGGTPYSGSLDTYNDEDWFLFYTAPGQHPVDVSFTGPSLDSCSVYYAVYGPSGEEMDSGEQENDVVRHVTFTASDANRYLVQLYHESSCIPAHWQFEVDSPDGGITTTAPGDSNPPPPDPGPGTTSPTSGPSHACLVARARVRRDRRAQAKLKRQLRHAHGRRRRSIKRRLHVVRHDLHVAVGRRRLHCP